MDCANRRINVTPGSPAICYHNLPDNTGGRQTGAAIVHTLWNDVTSLHTLDPEDQTAMGSTCWLVGIKSEDFVARGANVNYLHFFVIFRRGGALLWVFKTETL